ncbi:MAG: glycosyltransferase family 39 protein [Bacteroidota bacterium]
MASPGKRGFLLSVLLFLSAFLLLFCSQLVEKSMFIDGVWYAAIARNLTLGQGSFWQPQFSTTIFAQFYEHPPLVFGLQATFFQLLGDHFMTERSFSLLQYLLSAALIVGLWRISYPNNRQGQWLWFLPLLLWQANMVNYFYLPANVLDGTLSLFSLAALLLLFRATRAKSVAGYLAGAALMIFLALLSKGFTGLFPLAFLGIHTLVFRRWSWGKTMGYSLVLVAMLGGLVAGLFLLAPAAADSLRQYLDVQVMASLSGERRMYHFRHNQFFILGQLGMSLLPMVAVLVASRLMLWLRPGGERLEGRHRYALCFLLVGLSASLPLMVSPRQALLYLLPSMPYFSLAFALWAAPGASALWNGLLQHPFRLRLLHTAFSVLCIAGLLFSYHNYGRINQRDRAVISDAQQIAKIVGKATVLASTEYNMYISGYLMRDFQISLDTSRSTEAPFLLSTADQVLQQKEYEKLPIATQHYVLYQRKLNHQISLDNGKHQ